MMLLTVSKTFISNSTVNLALLNRMGEQIE